MTPRITTVLFDLGDTLCRSEDPPPFQAVLAEMARRVAALLRRWRIEPRGALESLGPDIYLAAQAAELEAYRTDCLSPHYGSICRDQAAAKGLRLTEAQGEELWRACYLGRAFWKSQLVPDALPTLGWLKGRGYRLGTVTNRAHGGGDFQAELQEQGLDSYLEVAVASCDVGYLKPHPRIFQEALEAMGVSPQETAMVGDSLRADVGGAKALGLTAVWKRRHDAYPQMERALFRAGLGPAFEPDYIIDDLRQLTRLPLLNHD